jgi:PAS domain S-box-containing protein
MNSEWTKLLLIIILCTISTLLTYYFHGILKTSTVFTHFYYIPIILSAIWWQRKGLIIAIILCLTLLIGHLLYGPTYLLSPYDNYIRIMIFLSVSVFVIYLSERIEKSRSALQSQKDQLEVVVQERTKELKQKVDDLSQAREAVFQSEAQVRKIIEHSPVGIQIIQNSRFVFANTKFVEMFGYLSENEIIGTPVETLFEPRYADLIRMINEETVAGKTLPRSHELIALKRSGVSFDVAIWLNIIDYQGVRSILCFVVDISLEKKMRNQIMQSQKMESIGTLAGGIAHKFNNALMLITGSVDLISYGFPPDHAVHKHINRILSSVTQMVDLNNLLLAYARKGQMRPKRTQLNLLIQETMMLLNQNELPCSIQTELAQGLPDIFADSTQIQMILTAILKNAIEATQEKGTITIHTNLEKIDPETTGMNSGTEAGNYVCLEVEDTGSGMTTVILEHIFDPFYTTHFQGRGLGMAAVYGIVKEHKGWINVASQPGKGTVVAIYLPVMN